MRILWLSANSGLYNNHSTGYNGGGWVASLQQLMQNSPDIELSLAFITSNPNDKEMVKEGTHYYPIYSKPLGVFAKLRHYYGGYKSVDETAYVNDVQRIIAEVRPDIIQLFGLECPLATILGKTDVPIIVHLQGLLAPCDNAFFPINLNKSSFVWPFTLNEWIMRNGYIYAKNSIHVRGVRERKLFKNVRYAMGRTGWDYEVSQLLASQSEYFHVDEVMRTCFYEHAGEHMFKARKRMIITSTISQTIYKGLDLVLKAASLLEHETDIDFEWRIVGVDGNSDYVRFFEKSVDMKTSKVCYMGVLDAEKLCDNLLDSDVYVHPSYIDNSPNSVCEAQLLGLPVIATNVGGVSSLVEHGVSGYLIPANAPYELAYRLKYISEHPDEAFAIGHKAALIAKKRHDRDEIRQQILSVYQSVLGEILTTDKFR